MTNSLTSGDSAVLGSPAGIPMVLGCCTAVSAGISSFSPGDDVKATLAGGTGSDLVYALLAQGAGLVRFSACQQTWSPAPSVTKTGSGPTVTCALAAGSQGCSDDHTIIMRVSTAGAGGAGGALSIAYDGSTEVDTVQIPAEQPAVLRGKVDISIGADLEGLHLDFTAPAAEVLTFAAGSLASSAAGIKAATATVAAPVTLTPSDLLAAGIAVILAHPRRLIFTTAGVTPANAPANVVITGTRRGVAVTETLALAQTATTATSLNDYDVITTLVYPAADGTAATIAIGYSSAFATSAEVIAAFNALAVAAPLSVRARGAEDTAGNTFLELYTTGSGTGVTQTIDDAASTADTPLGFTSVSPSNLTATGAAAVLTLPWTGLAFTFPVGTYILNTTYKVICTGPRATIGALSTAWNLARSNFSVTPFGFLVVAQPASSAANCRALSDAISTDTAAWYADGKKPTPVTSIINAPFFTASADKATNDAAILAADAALLAEFNGASPNLDSVALCDCYIQGSSSLVQGRFRRPASIPAAAKVMSKSRISKDIADGLCPQVTLLGPDNLTKARDDTTAATVLGQATGFYALESTSQGVGFVKFSVGQTRAGASSRLRYFGVVQVGLRIIQVVFPLSELWKGQTGPADPRTKMMTDDLREQRRASVYHALQPELLPINQEANVSQLVVTILDPPSGTWLDNGIVPIRVAFVPLGETTAVNVNVVATSQATPSTVV